MGTPGIHNIYYIDIICWEPLSNAGYLRLKITILVSITKLNECFSKPTIFELRDGKQSWRELIGMSWEESRSIPSFYSVWSQIPFATPISSFSLFRGSWIGLCLLCVLCIYGVFKFDISFHEWWPFNILSWPWHFKSERTCY